MNNRVFSILVEPAEYTKDLIRNIYSVREVDYAYMFSSSEASEHGEEDHAAVISKMGLFKRLTFLARALKNHEVFIVNGYTGSIPICFILLNILFFRKPFALESDTELSVPKGRVKRFLKRMWLGFLFSRKYCYGFAGGGYGHRDLFSWYGMAADRIFLAPMVVDNAKYIRKYKVKSNDKIFRFGYIGRLVKLKQIDKILEAMHQLIEGGHSLELCIVGDGPERLRLEELADGLPVRFCGALFGDEKVAALHSLDCLVLYSEREAWGLVINEALAGSIPVIVSDKVGSRHDLVMGDAPTGIVVKWNDVSSLADAMERIMANHELRSMLSVNASARAAMWNYQLYGKNFDTFLSCAVKGAR